MASSCDKVTGECDIGCNAGWAGIHCDQSKNDLSAKHFIVIKIITIDFKEFI